MQYKKPVHPATDIRETNQFREEIHGLLKNVPSNDDSFKAKNRYNHRF
jgi:hypothetical protein